jgi:hypothetical protein
VNVYALSFVVSFFYIGVKSIQQLNVSQKLYWLIPPFSILMALLEVYVVSTISKNGMEGLMELALALGLGGGFGSVCATYMHDKFLEKK